MTDLDLQKKFNITCPEKINTSDPVLVVEDQQDMRLILVHHLAKMTFSKVIQAANGYEALQIIRENPTLSVIISDMEMPVMGGIDLLSEMKEKTDINLSAFCLSMDQVSKEKVMFAVENGADEILAKPFTLNDITPKVHAAFRKFHNPKNPEKVYELAKKNLRAKKTKEAKLVYQALADAAETSARPLVGLARVAVLEKDFATAHSLLDKAQERNKFFVHLFALRAEIFAQQSKWDDALKNYRQAIDLSPLNPVRYMSACTILFEQKKYKEAIEVLEIAFSRGLEFKDLHHYMSQGYFALKDFNKAVRHVKSALGTDPDNVTYLNQLGVCYKELGQPEEASKTYNQIIKLDPENVAAMYNKAVLLASKGEKEEAIKNLERALKKDPTFAQAKKKIEEIKNDASKGTTVKAAS